MDHSMEKRQLDFNAPLLSARRFSSPRNSSELVKRTAVEKRPPGRQQSVPLNKTDWESDEITKPAAVPFNWERSPGRPKNEEIVKPVSMSRNSGETPRLPPGRLSGPSKYFSGERSNDPNIYRPQAEDHASLLEKLKDDSSSEGEDEAYSDALNTLSLTETCSASGVSGYNNSGTKHSGKFCVDKQTRDFMMNRFLPAAKAAVLETPQYAVKKPTAVNEEPKEVKKKVVSGELLTNAPIRKYNSDVVPYYGHFDYNNVESDDEDSVVPVKKSGRSWGIIPRICVKNSLCLLNPLPAMKSKSRTPTPSDGDVRRMRRNAVSGPLDKNGCQVPLPPKKKYHSGLLSRDTPGFENKPSNDSYSLLNTRESPRSGLSPLRRYRSGSISPYRNESPKSAFLEGAGFLGVPREIENINANKIASSRKMFKALQDVSKTQQINERGSSGPVEKTVYVDSISKKTVRPGSKSSRTKSNGIEVQRNYSVKSDKEEGKKMSSKYADEIEDIKLYLSVDNQEPKALERNDVVSDVKFGKNEDLKLESDDVGETDIPLKSPLPPPLPKSPSESWLWRTLPSIPLGNPFAHSRRNSQIPSKKQGRKSDTKWETIVKTSNLRHDHSRYSEELIPNASYRQSKS